MLSLQDLQDKNIHIVGFSSVEGSSIAAFLWKNGIKNLTLHDFCEEADFVKSFAKFNTHLRGLERKSALDFLKELPVQKHFKDTYLQGIETADLIFTGQAWYLYECNLPKLQEVFESGIPFRTIINLYLDLFPGKAIGVTGSNGKTTTCALLHHVLQDQFSGNVFISGNERSSGQSLSQLLSASKDDALILEISNRQLKLIGGSRLDYGVLTNISENHLNEHLDYRDYALTKFRICQNATKCVVTKDDPGITQFMPKDLLPTYAEASLLDAYGVEFKNMQLKGDHNILNIASVLGLISVLEKDGLLTIGNETLKKSFYEFGGVSKRLQNIGESDGVQIINDLSSTTPTSTLAAIEAYESKPFSLVLGGQSKQVDYNELLEKISQLQNSKTLVKLFCLPGDVQSALASAGIDHTEVTSFEEIAENTFETLGKALLISPAGEKVISTHLKNKGLKRIFGL